MGAWIEIKVGDVCFRILNAAPFVGAWIEISVDKTDAGEISRRTLRGCVD